MDKELLKLRKITSFMKKNGVLTLKTPEGIEISLSPAMVLNVPKGNAKDEPDEQEDDKLTDEEILLYSSSATTRVE